MSHEDSKIYLLKKDVLEECIKKEGWGSLPQMNQ